MRFEFAIGIGEDALRQKLQQAAVHSITRRLVRESVSRFGGVMYATKTGCYVNPSGEVVEEPVLTLTCEVDNAMESSVARDHAWEIAHLARQQLRQESVLLTEIGSSSTLVRKTVADQIADGEIGLD